MGKTTTTVNLGIGLANQGHRVLHVQVANGRPMGQNSFRSSMEWMKNAINKNRERIAEE